MILTNRLAIISILVLILVSAIGLILFISKKPSADSVSSAIDQAKEAVAAVAPEPFYELTIPYLRGRQYQSSLGEQSVVNSYGNYTSYLTSYTSDGLKINGLLTKPTGQMPEGGWPAVVFVHGYIPPNQYQTLAKYVDYVDYLARNGFVVFKIDLRGHGESEGTPGGGYYSSDYVIDTLNAYAALQSTDFVNKQKIGLWGHSMAGNVVLRSLAAKPEIPAAVIWAGAGYSYTDLQTYGLSDASYRPQPSDSARQNSRQKLRDLYGDPNSGNAFWKEVAPTNYLNDLKGAIELNHAVDDQTVNIAYSRDLNKLLDQTQVPHQFYEYPSGDHNISGASFSLAMQRTVQFYKQYLKS